jgi:NDP-4-keto-2,6-dideoxyhexose 3-C-methyltransferase
MGDLSMVMDDPTVLEIRRCRLCGGGQLQAVIDLGPQYIASIFTGEDVTDHLKTRYPLEVVRCASKRGCGLVQLRHSVSRKLLYSHYGYLSGINEAMCANLRDIAEKVERMAGLAPGDLVADIGCNDGTLLSFYQADGLDRLGFEPADNVSRLARDKGLDVVPTFFSSDAFRRARPDRKAKAVTSIAMFYDLEDPGEFVGNIASILADDGVWVIELSYLPFMLANTSYDTICHEHLEYYSLRQITWMLDRHGLKVHGIEFNNVNGGSFRLFIRREEAGPVPGEIQQTIRAVEEREERLGLASDAPYLRFKAQAEKVSRELRALLDEITAIGKKVYIYGASTKGNTILQYCGVDKTIIPKAADRNPDKWRRRTLGTDIFIISEEQARRESPDYFLVLPWHFIDVFRKREEEFLTRGGKFILPLPEVRVIGRDDQ